MNNGDMLNKYFHLDDEKRLRWKIKSGSRGCAGGAVGSMSRSGYLCVQLKGKKLLVHRVVFFLDNGYMPDMVDHIDGDKTNNHPSNLREANRTQNGANSKVSKNNSTGLKGVYRNGGIKNPFCAKIRFNGVIHYLGRFKTADDAKAAYDKKAIELCEGFHSFG